MVQIIFPASHQIFFIAGTSSSPAAAQCPAPRDSGPSDEEWSGRSQGRWRPPLRASVRKIFVYAGKNIWCSSKNISDSLNGVLAMCGDNTGEGGHGPPGLHDPAYSHMFSGLGSSSGVSSATSSASASSLDRASTGSASSTSGNKIFLVHIKYFWSATIKLK